MSDNYLKEDVFKLKGRLFTLTVLEISPCHLSEFKANIERIYNKAPNMFSGTPMVLDLKLLKGNSFDLRGIIDTMKLYHMIPVAVQHASMIQQKSAAACGLSVLLSRDGNESEALTKALNNADAGSVVTNSIRHRQSNEQVSRQKEAVSIEKIVPEVSHHLRQSKVITQPVRSGQQIYAKDADLIVLASVGTGAELLADGHIHVYGALRGRALAGIKGDTSARIFCSTLNAELVSIAGQYLMPEPGDMKNSAAKQVLIQDGHLKIIDL